MKQEIIVMSDDPGIVEYRKNIEGWVGKDGRFFGKDEAMARRLNSTHHKCDCGEVIRHGWSKCDSCSYKSRKEKYDSLPYVKYNGEPVFAFDGGEYFYDEDALIDYMVDNELNEIDLYPSIEQHYFRIEPDHWVDVMPSESDEEIPVELERALNEFNKVIDSLPPASWTEDRSKRTSYKLEKEDYERD